MPLTAEKVIKGEVQPFEVPIKVSKETGLDEPSCILTNRIHTIDKELRLIKKLGKVDNKTWKQIWQSLWVILSGQEK